MRVGEQETECHTIVRTPAPPNSTESRWWEPTSAETVVVASFLLLSYNAGDHQLTKRKGVCVFSHSLEVSGHGHLP